MPRIDITAISEVFCQISLLSTTPVTGNRLGNCGINVTDGSTGTSVAVGVSGIAVLVEVGVGTGVRVADEPPDPGVRVYVGGITAEVGITNGFVKDAPSTMSNVGCVVVLSVDVSLRSTTDNRMRDDSSVATCANTADGNTTCQQASTTTMPIQIRMRV